MKYKFSTSDKIAFVALIISILTLLINFYSDNISNKILSEEIIELKTQNEILLENNQISKLSQYSNGIFEVHSKTIINTITGINKVIPYQVVFSNIGNKLITINEIGYKDLNTGEHYNLHAFSYPYIFSWEIESETFDRLKTEDIIDFPTSVYVNILEKNNLNLTDIQFYVKDINGDYYYDSSIYHRELQLSE